MYNDQKIETMFDDKASDYYITFLSPDTISTG